MPDKERLDVLLREKGICKSREKAKREIMAGNVYVAGQLKDKPGRQVPKDADITVKGRDQQYVSRGGKKLEGALDEFGIDVDGFKALDIGASTGGFTDCLLQNGARKVWALDVGKGQLDWNLRQDDRVTPIEGKNARYLKPEEIGTRVDLVTIDVSFISLELILPPAKKVLKPDGEMVTLVKPQFEAGPESVEKGGVVTDPDVHIEVLENVLRFARDNDLEVINCTYSQIQGKSSKNIEYLLYLSGSENEGNPPEFREVVNSAHDDFQTN